MTPILLIPGYQNSGEGHWQSLWEADLPGCQLLFPSILAASSNDPFLALDRARGLAADWGSRLVELGPCGHLNTASGYGPWLRGEALLEELR